MSAQLQTCKTLGIPENGLGFFIKLDNPTNLKSIISGYQPVLIKWHSGYETIKYDSGAKVGLLEIIKIDTENPEKGNKIWGTKIQRVVGLNGYYNWYPARSGRYVISIIPCKTVINNVCSLGDSAVGERVEVMINKAGCSDFWAQAKACPQAAASDTNNGVDTVKYSVDARGCAVAQCLGDQPIIEPISEPTCSTVYKPRLMSSVASLSASKLGEGKATFRFTLVAPKERSIDISAFGMSGYDNSAPGTNPLPMEIISVSASVPKQGDIYTIPAGRLAVFTVTGTLKSEKRQYYYAVLDRVDWNCQGVTLETGNLFLGGGKEPKTNAAFIAVQTNINSPKLSFVSFPGDKDRNLIVPGENTAGYYPLIGHIGFKALEKDAVINNIRGKIFAFDKNGIPKPVSAVLRKVYLSYEGVTLGEFVITGDRPTADFSFDNLSFKISKAGTPNIALGQEVLEFLAIANQDVKNGDYIIWQADQAQGTNDSGENIATDNILKGKKIYFSHAYTDFVLASANITKIFEKYGESDVAEATFIFKVSPMGKDAYIKSSDLRLSSNLPADITTSISADNLAELNTVTDQYLIHDGSTATFMIKGLIKPQTTGYYYLALLPINWSDGADSFTFSLVNDFRTPSMWLKYYSPNNNCGNGICESGENTTSCAQDCIVTPATSCSTTYKPRFIFGGGSLTKDAFNSATAKFRYTIQATLSSDVSVGEASIAFYKGVGAAQEDTPIDVNIHRATVAITPGINKDSQGRFIIKKGQSVIFESIAVFQPKEKGYYTAELNGISWNCPDMDLETSNIFSTVPVNSLPRVFNYLAISDQIARKRVMYYTASMFDNYNEVLKRIQALIKP